jgi:hypothetical protein
MGFSKIENGTITTAKELLLDMCECYGVKTIGDVIQYGTPSNYHKEQLDKVTKEYTEFQNKTDEELKKYIDETFVKITKEREEYIIYYKDKKEKYNNIIKQLKLWDHTETWDNMCNNIMKDLIKDYEFAEDMIQEYSQPYKKETLEEYKRYMIKDYLEKIKRYSDYYAKEIENVEENNRIIKEFEDSLKSLDNKSINDELNKPKEPTNTSFSSHDCCSVGKCPNCGNFVDNYKNKCTCGQVLQWR